MTQARDVHIGKRLPGVTVSTSGTYDHDQNRGHRLAPAASDLAHMIGIKLRAVRVGWIGLRMVVRYEMVTIKEIFFLMIKKKAVHELPRLL